MAFYFLCVLDNKDACQMHLPIADILGDSGCGCSLDILFLLGVAYLDAAVFLTISLGIGLWTIVKGLPLIRVVGLGIIETGS